MCACSIDIGTMFLVSARQEGSDEIKFITQRNCFCTIENEEGAEDMLSGAGAKFTKEGNKLNILGEDAIRFANMFSSFSKESVSNLKRPMKDGLINTSEETLALSIIEKLISGIVGKPQKDKEVCVYSVPANAVDSQKTNGFHQARAKQILTKLGYKASPVNEGLAIIYAENPKMGDATMSGLGISFGAGQCNVCFAYRGYPVVEFSVARSGDFIDQQVANVTGKKPSVVSKIKEKDFSFDKAASGDMVMMALDIHYTEMINYVLNIFAKKFMEAEKAYDDPIEIVVAGGTACPDGFLDKMKEVIDDMDLPFEVSNIRKADDMLRTVSKGCFVKAMQLEAKGDAKNKTEEKPKEEKTEKPRKEKKDEDDIDEILG